VTIQLNEPSVAPERLSRPKARRRKRKNVMAAVCGGLLVLYVAVAVLGPVFVEFDTRATSLPDRLLAPGERTADGRLALLGTDQLGQDIFAQVVVGARTSLWVSAAAVLLAAVTGSVVGLVSGYVGGKLDSVLMRLVDMQMAFPTILLAILIAGALGQSVFNVILALALANWVVYARVVRSQVLTLKSREFVDATRTLGAAHWHLLRHCIIPGCWASILVVATVDVGSMMLAEASLSFLGLGVPSNTASWGRTIFNGQSYLQIAWWISAMPGLALTLVVVALGFVGDHLRDRLDPKAA
jgi:peptide/nickel transport system permease protein